jgi:hypothetical protein
MLRLPNHSAASVTRPSLLMHFLRAIGPGVAICKAGPAGSRNDSTALELLRDSLYDWDYLPNPDSGILHNITEDARKYQQALRNLLSYEAFGGKKPNSRIINNFKEWRGLSVPMIRRWGQAMNQFSGGNWESWLEGKVFVPQTAPVVIVGSPEGFLGYDSPTTPPTSLPFYNLLKESGYSDNFQILMQHYGGGIKITGNTTHTIDRKDGCETDVGIVFLGRTDNGRTVVVLAGSSNTFGTLSAVRIATDYGRNEVSSMVLDFMKHDRKKYCATVFSTERTLPKGVSKPFRLADPINIRFIYASYPKNAMHDLEIRQTELKLKSLDATPEIPQAEQTTLAKYLSSQGPVGVVTKWYPSDLRDDAAAMDIIEFTLDSSLNYPVPPNLPWSNNSQGNNLKADIDLFLASDDESSQVTPRSQKISPVSSTQTLSTIGDGEEETLASEKTIASSLMEVDGESKQLLKIWMEAITKHEIGDAAFANWFDSQYPTPTDASVVILGRPESFLGAGTENSTVLTNLGRLLKDANYPNRYELPKTGERQGSSWGIIDRRTFTRVYPIDGNVDPEGTLSDGGIVSLSKGPSGRDLLIIAGITWLGTLAGVRLLFTQQRPSVDNLIESYIKGERERIDFYFTCKTDSALINPFAFSGAKDSDGDLWSAIKEPEDIVIDTHNSEIDFEFIKNKKSERIFRKLFESIDAKQGGKVELPVEEKDYFTYSLDKTSDHMTISVDCMKLIQSSDDSYLLCGKKISDLYAGIDNAYNQDSRFVNPKKKAIGLGHGKSMHSAMAPFCGKYLVLGESGVGKENVAHYLFRKLQPGTRNEKSFSVVSTPIIQGNLVQSQIFGTVRGAFTDSGSNESVFEKSLGGVCFFDEFAARDDDASLALQANLLRALENNSFNRLGSNEELFMNCLFVAATNRASNKHQLQKLVDRGAIRDDIFNRFEGRLFFFPSLKDRPLEILPAFIMKIYKKYDLMQKARPVVRIDRNALMLLLHHHFPGNFRDVSAIAGNILRINDPHCDRTAVDIDFPVMYRCIAMEGDFEIQPVFTEFTDFITVKITVQGKDLPIHKKVTKRVEESSVSGSSIGQVSYKAKNGKKKSRPEVASSVRSFADMTTDKSYRFVTGRDHKNQDAIESEELGGNERNSIYVAAFNEIIKLFHVDRHMDYMQVIVNHVASWNEEVTRVRGIQPRTFKDKPIFYRCIYMMSKASVGDYAKLLENSRAASCELSTRTAFAIEFLNACDEYRNTDREIPWELQVTVVFILTGLDCRTDSERHWMNWVASRHGAVEVAGNEFPLSPKVASEGKTGKKRNPKS